MDSKSHPKIDIGAIRGPTFAELFLFLIGCFLERSWGSTAWSSFYRTSGATWAKKAKVRATFGRVGGRGGRLGNLVLLVSGDRL